MTPASSGVIISSPSSLPPPPPVFSGRLAVGLLGMLLAAMVAGLNGRVPGLVLADLRGALGLGLDEGSWLTTAYSAGELAAMPFATWFAVTFSLRRFHLTLLFVSLVLSAILPYTRDLYVLLTLRLFQGLFGGAMIPLLMMGCLRFLPTPIRLHGLAIFALTATFSPNVALWLAALWVDRLEDWRWVYWHVIPIGLLAACLVSWGIPKMPTALPRLKKGNWFGMALGIPGLILLVISIDQGVRLDWLRSPLIAATLFSGLVFTALFALSEWLHSTPFNQLRLLGRRNLAIGFICFAFILMTMTTAVTLPANVLGNLQGFRLAQTASLGLIVGVPQLLLGPCVALLLYRQWIDARQVLAAGLACMSLACWFASGITSEWMAQQFLWAEILHAIGQPLSIVPLLFLMTSSVQPMEGPFLAGLVNIIRVFSATTGSAIIGQLTAMRGRFHTEMLLDNAGQILPRHPSGSMPGTLAEIVAQQSSVLAAADIYRIFAVLALLLIPLAIFMKYIPAPRAKNMSSAPLAPSDVAS